MQGIMAQRVFQSETAPIVVVRKKKDSKGLETRQTLQEHVPFRSSGLLSPTMPYFQKFLPLPNIAIKL